jgi:uncharacterized protein
LTGKLTEPLYIRAENGQLPELQRVIAIHSDRIVMANDLESTLAALFKPGEAATPSRRRRLSRRSR